MSIPVLVRSVGPEPSAGYYTQWTTFVPGYPKFKNQDTGVTQGFYNGEAVEENLIAYRAHYLYFTGMAGEIIDRLVDIPLPLPSAGQYYDIPVTAYDPGSTGLNPDAGSSSGTAQPSGPARLDITVTESFALSTGNAKVTPWRLPRFTQERAVSGAKWANLSAVQVEDYATAASVPLASALTTELLGQDFGFGLPSGAQISGIEVEVARKVLGGAAEKRQSMVSADYYSSSLVRSDDWFNFYNVYTSPSDDSFERFAYGNGVFIAVGNGAPISILRSSDEGRTWSAISHPSTATTAMGVAYSNGVWIITQYGVLGVIDYALRSTDNGLTWALVPLGFGTSQNHFKRSPTSNGAGVWVVGGSNGNVSRSTDNGATWALIEYVTPSQNGITGIVWTGVKFVLFGVIDIVANSADGASWTNRDYGATALINSSAYPTMLQGKVVYIDTQNGNIFHSSDNGDTWAVAASPVLDARYSVVPGYSVYYDELNRVYRWLGTYVNYYWTCALESDDFPPTSFRVSEYLSAHNDWHFYLVALAPATPTRYGLSFEATHLLAPSPVSGQIFGEGYAVPGGPFTYDLAELFEGRNSAALTSWDVGRFGGDGLRGADAGVDEGTRTWTAAEINDPAFGVGYFARGQQGTLEVAFIRARIHYRADPTTDTIPAKRSNGLAGVAESPSGVKVAVGVDGKILRKPANSPTWSAVSSGTTVSLNAVEWVGDRFIAVGMFGMALDGGADGSTWTRVETGAVAGLWAIKRVPDTLRAVAVGNDDNAFERGRQGSWTV